MDLDPQVIATAIKEHYGAALVAVWLIGKSQIYQALLERVRSGTALNNAALDQLLVAPADGGDPPLPRSGRRIRESGVGRGP